MSRVTSSEGMSMVDNSSFVESDRGLFERDCNTAIQQAEECFVEIATSESISRPKDLGITRAAEAIARVRDILSEAEKRGYINLSLPEGYRSAVQAEQTLTQKFSEAKVAVMQKRYKYTLEYLQSGLHEWGASLYSNFEAIMRDLEDLVKFNPDQLSRNDLWVDFDHVREQVEALWQNRYKELGAEDADIEYLAGQVLQLSKVKKLLTRNVDGLGEEK